MDALQSDIESLDRVIGTDDDVLDPLVANLNEDAVYSGVDPIDTAGAQDLDDEDEA